jgi:hypothetical protein
VAKSELICSTPILPKIAVKAAKIAEQPAHNIHEEISGFIIPLNWCARPEGQASDIMSCAGGLSHGNQPFSLSDLGRTMETRKPWLGRLAANTLPPTASTF